MINSIVPMIGNIAALKIVSDASMKLAKMPKTTKRRK
jgi:hypothetical protein